MKKRILTEGENLRRMFNIMDDAEHDDFGYSRYDQKSSWDDINSAHSDHDDIVHAIQQRLEPILQHHRLSMPSIDIEDGEVWLGWHNEQGDDSVAALISDAFKVNATSSMEAGSDGTPVSIISWGL